MKKIVFPGLIILIVLILHGIAIADSPDWTLVQIPGSDGAAFPVYFDTNTYLASDITTDTDDNLYVMSGSRIIRFAPGGQIDQSWGNNGILYDEFFVKSNCEQLGIAADGRGYVYAHCRLCEDGSPTFIKRYTPDGETDNAWYGDGVMGGKFSIYDDGTFSDELDEDETEPLGGIRNQDEIALDSKDNLYILYDREVYRFLPDGTPDGSWRKPKLKQPKYQYDEGGESVWYDNALRIDWQDHIYLFNGYDHTVSKYNPNGELINKEKCGLYHPYDYYGETKYLIGQVAFDTDGNLYQSEYEKNTISKCSPVFKLISAWCGNGVLSALSYENQRITDFVSDTKGNIYILDGESETVSKYTSEGKTDIGWAFKGSLGNVNGDGEPMPHVNDVIFDNDGSIYIVDQKDYEAPALYKLNSDFTLTEGWMPQIDNTAEWEFGYASSVAVQDGYIYVEQDYTDVQVWKSRIIRLDSGGELDTGWQMIVDGFIHSMITDKEGRLYIADSDCLITRYTPDGGKDSGFGSGGILEDGHITAMAADRNGYLYACVGEFNRVTRYTPEGTPDTGWGTGGDIIIPDIDEGGESYGISSIAVDDFCNLYVSDTTNNRILRYDSSGKPDTLWCDNGEWRSADTMSDAPAPMQCPARVIVFKGDLYAVWNYKLYKMRDTLAQAGSKTGAGPQASANVSPENARETVVILNGHDKYVNWWWWAIGAGALILCAGAVFWVLKRRGK